MTRFEPRTSGVGSNCFTNWATTTAPQILNLFLLTLALREKSLLKSAKVKMGKLVTNDFGPFLFSERNFLNANLDVQLKNESDLRSY